MTYSPLLSFCRIVLPKYKYKLGSQIPEHKPVNPVTEDKKVKIELIYGLNRVFERELEFFIQRKNYMYNLEDLNADDIFEVLDASKSGYISQEK